MGKQTYLSVLKLKFSVRLSLALALRDTYILLTKTALKCGHF